MVSISGLAQSLKLESPFYNASSASKDRVFIDDPYVDKVSLSDGQPDPDMTYQHLAKNRGTTTAQSGDTDHKTHDRLDKEDPDRLDKMMQQVLDSKTGVDRKKLEEIEEKIEALTNKEGELTKAEKTQLDILQKQKEQLIKEGSKKLSAES